MLFPKVDYWHKNPVASLDYMHALTSLLYITAHERKAPIYKLSRSKAPKTQQVVG